MTEPLEPGSPEWFAHAEVVISEEIASGEAQWWWLSFTDPTLPKGTQFLGAAIVRGNGIATAVLEATRLGINPGGQVVGYPIPPEFAEETIPYRGRLLAKAEAESLA